MSSHEDRIDEVADAIDQLKTTVEELAEDPHTKTDQKALEDLQKAVGKATDATDELQPNLEVTSFGVVERPEELARPHALAHVARHEIHGRLLRRGERTIDVEPHVRIPRHRRGEHRLRRKAEGFHRRGPLWAGLARRSPPMLSTLAPPRVAVSASPFCSE
jgi:hypothetical protein